MRTILRFSWLALVTTGLFSSPVLAGKVGGDSAKPQSGTMHVEDKAGIFSTPGIDAAVAHFDSHTFQSRTHLSVVTRTGVPESKKADFEATKGTDKAKLNQLFDAWAKELAKEHRESGVFVLVYTRGEKYFVKAIVDRANDVYRSFTDADCSALEKKMFAAIDAAHKQTGDEAKKTCDSGLMDSTNFTIDQLRDTSLPEAKHHASSSTSSDEHPKSTGMGIIGWVCIIGVVLIGVWITIALIRMMTGAVPGYGYGYGGYGYGGGLGFFGGFMGGMFGAMAGMYLYDQFSGHHYYNDNYGGDNYGGDNYGDGGSQDVGEGDWDSGGSGDGAGNWGDSGGDTGGGGDWGGGDTGGGGDWGGGGDFGGGGDW